MTHDKAARIAANAEALYEALRKLAAVQWVARLEPAPREALVEARAVLRRIEDER